MVLDIQTVHHILKNTAVQNKQTVCLHYGLDFPFKNRLSFITSICVDKRFGCKLGIVLLLLF
jgi:hypothetical protein